MWKELSRVKKRTDYTMNELQNLVNKCVLAEDGVMCIWLDPEDIESRKVECKVGLRRIIFYIKALSHDIAIAH